MTAILQLALIRVQFETSDNEDWRDGVAFVTAGSATGYPVPGIVGNGYVSNPAVMPGADLGAYAITMTGASGYQVRDPDGELIGIGLVGIPWSRSGISFNLVAGTIPFVAGDTLAISVLPKPIDITGIDFEMDVRLGLGATSYLYASTGNGYLVNDGATGVLGFAVPQAKMERLPPGELISDILGHGDGITRRCVTMEITHSRGVTSPR